LRFILSGFKLFTNRIAERLYTLQKMPSFNK
jgi:hypothetical protein